jgi:DNA-binding response OmpR family regulator
MKSIIVEDEFLIGAFLKKTLEKKDIEVLDVIDNQEEAISAINTFKPDLVVIDKNLKHGGCGIEVFKRCKNNNIQFLFVTGTNKNIINDIISLGCEVISKPFDSVEFLKLLDRSLIKS